jgi:hypothetical protein
VTRHEERYAALRFTLLARRRAPVVAMGSALDDIVLRRLRARSDIEEVRPSPPDPVE